jgi:hypothetical protein
VKSYVEVSVVGGALWSKVVNLVEEQSSFVVEAMDVYATAKRAAFNVEVKDDAVEIDVFNDEIDVRTAESADKLVSGQKAVLNSDKQVEIAEISESDRNVAWVSDNLNSDEEYLLEVEARLLAAKMESVGVSAVEDYDFDTSMREGVTLFLTFDDVEKKKVELDLAEKDFIAAEIKLSEEKVLDKDEKVEVEGALSAFSETVEEFYGLVDEVGYADSEYAEELKRYVEDKVLTQKKNLSLISEESPSYEAKVIVDELADIGSDDLEEVSSVVEPEVSDVVEVEGALVEDNVEQEVEKTVEEVAGEEYGVDIEGDKPLPPFLNL